MAYWQIQHCLVVVNARMLHYGQKTVIFILCMLRSGILKKQLMLSIKNSSVKMFNYYLCNTFFDKPLIHFVRFLQFFEHMRNLFLSFYTFLGSYNSIVFIILFIKIDYYNNSFCCMYVQPFLAYHPKSFVLPQKVSSA